MSVFPLLVLVLNKHNYNHTKKVNPIQLCVVFRVDEEFPPRRQVFVTVFSLKGSQNGFNTKLTKPRDSYLKFVCTLARGGGGEYRYFLLPPNKEGLWRLPL